MDINSVTYITFWQRYKLYNQNTIQEYYTTVSKYKGQFLWAFVKTAYRKLNVVSLLN